MGADQKRYAVFAVRSTPGGTVWVRVGSGTTNRDASINITLDALPIGDPPKLHLRDAATVKENQQPEKEQRGDPRHGECGGRLEFVAEIAAPGIGQSWRCTKCGAKVLRVRGAFRNADDVDPSEIELTPREVE